MKKDNLEKFIQQHRADFDDAVPNLKVWAEIDKKVNPPKAKRRSIGRWSRWAAAAVLLLLVGIAMGLWMSKPASNALASLSDVSAEHAELEDYYVRQVNQKKKQLASFEKENLVQEDLKQLDKIMEELQSDFQKAPKGSEEVIINAMIQNYQTKLMILESVLKNLENQSSTKEKNNETINI